MTSLTTPLGELREDADGTRTLVFRRSYPDPIEDVWAAITESDRLARWLGSYEGEAVASGSVRLTMTAPEDAGGEPASVRIVDCRPPNRLVVDITEADGRPWRIALTLGTENGATTLLFEQSLPPDLDPADVGVGWHWYLDRLEASLTDAAMPAWGEYFPALVNSYRSRTELVRAAYGAYESGDRSVLDELLADNFRFYSPADAGIDRATYFERCWPNAAMIDGYEFKRLAEVGDEVVVTYEATRTDGTRFRNTEVLTFDGGRLARVEVYFGWDLE